MYVNADNPDIKLQLENKNHKDLARFVQGHKLLVIDEAQRVSDIGLTLKIIHDSYPDIQIIATGSSSFELANQTKEPLTGRSLEFTLLPLSLKEIENYTSKIEAKQMIDTALLYGCYPGVLYGELDRAEFTECLGFAVFISGFVFLCRH